MTWLWLRALSKWPPVLHKFPTWYSPVVYCTVHSKANRCVIVVTAVMLNMLLLDGASVCFDTNLAKMK